MAHQTTDIELSPGVTVITGANNIGKSAIVEAVRYLVYNPPPKNVIRHGAKQALVRLELDSGEKITWLRQDKHASYIIEQPGREPQEYHKFGRDVPDDVRALLRLEQVKTDTDDLDIHLGNQRQPIFLLDRPGSHAAGFFAASTEADYLLKMQQALKRRTEQASRDKKRLEAELADLAATWRHYLPLDDLEVVLIRAEADYAAILDAAQRLPLLAQLIVQVAATEVQLARQRDAATIMGQLASPPPLLDLSGLAFLLGELEDHTRAQSRELARLAASAGLAPPPALAATGDLEARVSDLEESLDRQAIAQDRHQVLSDLAGPPDVLGTSELAGLIQTLQAEAATLEVAARQNAVLTLTNAPPALAVVGDLPTLIRELAGLTIKIGALDRQRSALEPMASPPALTDLEVLTELVAAITWQQDRAQCWRHKFDHLSGLLPPPETVDLGDLEEMLNSLLEGLAALARLQFRQEEDNRRLGQKKDEIREVLKEAGVCPLCGHSLDLEHFLEGKHA